MPTAAQIQKRFDALPEQEQTAFLLKLIDRKPDEEVNLVEMFEETFEFRESCYDAILAFADRFRKAHPTIYEKEYEFLELKLTEHAFDTNDKKLIDRCLGVIARNPCRGIDSVTMVTLYRLIYHGMYEEAVAYSHAVWKPIANDEELWGYPELPFITTIFYDGVEKQYERLRQGDAAGWQDMMEGMTSYGFDNEKERIDTIFDALTTDLDAERLIQSLRKEPEYGLITLLYHFLRFMKDNYKVPFMHAGLMMDLLRSKQLKKYYRQPGALLYVPHKALDKHITGNLDTFMGVNQLEMFGKVWGLHYVYEFLFEYGLIDQKHYDKMLVTLATLKKDFLTVLGTNRWHAKFVLAWPASKADTLTADPGWFDKNSTGPELSIGKFVRKITGMDEPRDDDEPYSDGKIPVEVDDDWAEDNNPYIAEKKPGRNEPCPCGSGKKYKKCCHKTK